MRLNILEKHTAHRLSAAILSSALGLSDLERNPVYKPRAQTLISELKFEVIACERSRLVGKFLVELLVKAFDCEAELRTLDALQNLDRSANARQIFVISAIPVGFDKHKFEDLLSDLDEPICITTEADLLKIRALNAFIVTSDPDPKLPWNRFEISGLVTVSMIVTSIAHALGVSTRQDVLLRVEEMRRLAMEIEGRLAEPSFVEHAKSLLLGSRIKDVSSSEEFRSVAKHWERYIAHKVFIEQLVQPSDPADKYAGDTTSLTIQVRETEVAISKQEKASWSLERDRPSRTAQSPKDMIEDLHISIPKYSFSGRNIFVAALFQCLYASLMLR